ncbi:YIP1 family protein [Thioclava sp. GXIMD4216]|uniref:YIP1 family protein n=1 Tax=Thioclava litoralis TaxID=3076557 RepID=A0ABZ1E0W3_9RHOB|nr:YIP1 family protein [Thioclava sp. FTW29]
MSALSDILRSYRAPRQVVRDHLSHAPSEPRALTFLLSALVLVYIAQWPGLSRFAFENPATPLPALMLGQALGLLVAVPLFYLVALIARGVAKLLGGKGSGYGARIALFWALLAASPLLLLRGLVSGFIGVGHQANMVGVATFLVFVIFWISGMRVAFFETTAKRG